MKIVVMMMAPGGVPAPPEARGRDPPSSSSSLTFSLDGRRVSLWSMVSMAWEGREPLRDWICLSVSLCFCVPRSGLSPFLIFPEIRNSDWVEIWTRFLSGYWLSCGERRAPITLRSGHEGLGLTPHPRGPLGHCLALIPLPKIHIYSKKIFVSFYPILTLFDMDFLRNKKHATNRNWHWALDQYVSPKNSIKICQKYMKVV